MKLFLYLLIKKIISDEEEIEAFNFGSTSHKVILSKFKISSDNSAVNLQVTNIKIIRPRLDYTTLFWFRMR